MRRALRALYVLQRAVKCFDICSCYRLFYGGCSCIYSLFRGYQAPIRSVLAGGWCVAGWFLGLNLGRIGLKGLWDVRGQLLKWEFYRVVHGWAVARAGFGAEGLGCGLSGCIALRPCQPKIDPIQINHGDSWAIVPVARLRT